MHKTGWYTDLRIVFTHSFEHEIPNLVFNLVSLEKKFGAIVSWVLNIEIRIETHQTTSSLCSICNRIDARWCSCFDQIPFLRQHFNNINTLLVCHQTPTQRTFLLQFCSLLSLFPHPCSVRFSPLIPPPAPFQKTFWFSFRHPLMWLLYVWIIQAYRCGHYLENTENKRIIVPLCFDYTERGWCWCFFSFFF